MRRLAASLLGCIGLTGCFYLEPINQRPSIDIRQTSSDLVYRNSMVVLDAVANDPEGHLVAFRWLAYTCVDANDESTCDFEPFYTEILDEAKFVVPETLADGVTPVESLLVILRAQDDYGAIARPEQRLIIPVANHAPRVDTSMSVRYAYVIGAPVELYVKVGDHDDGPASLVLDWKVFSPMNQPEGGTLEPIDVPDPDPENELQEGMRFTPPGVGKWEIQVTATDPLGAATTKSFVIDAVPDQAPCLAQWAPIAPPVGSALPLTEPALFQVTVVTDDLDPFPTINDPQLGTTSFAWSIKQPGAATRTPLAVSGNGVALDPANYAPGDIVELRVEIADRNATPINCAEEQPTCSVITNDACIQRLTWRVEVH